jgi:hypothetical protein
MNDINPNKPKRKQPKLTLLQIMALVILGGCILMLAHHYAWF